MTGVDPTGADPRLPDAGRRPPGTPRGPVTLAIVAATVLGGVGALVVLVVSLQAPDVGTFDVLMWSALAVLLFASAAHYWWKAGHDDRSHRIAAEVGPAQVEEAVEGSTGEVDAVRRLRTAHPGLGLKDALDLVRALGGARS